MRLFDWIKQLRQRTTPDYPIPKGGIDALRADQETTLAYGIRPEQAERIAKREDDPDAE